MQNKYKNDQTFFPGEQKEADIGILILEKTVPAANFVPICLPKFTYNLDVAITKEAFVAGWGMEASDEPSGVQGCLTNAVGPSIYELCDLDQSGQRLCYNSYPYPGFSPKCPSWFMLAKTKIPSPFDPNLLRKVQVKSPNHLPVDCYG